MPALMYCLTVTVVHSTAGNIGACNTTIGSTLDIATMRELWNQPQLIAHCSGSDVPSDARCVHLHGDGAMGCAALTVP